MDKRKVSTVQTLDLKNAASYLEDLLDAFKKGTITVTKGEENVVLSPTSPVFLEIEAKKRKNKERFSFELSWHTPCEAVDEEDGEVLTISSKLPAPKPEEAPKPAETTKPEDSAASTVAKDDKSAMGSTQPKK